MRAHICAFMRSTPAAAHWSVALVMLAWVIKAVWLDDVPAPYFAMVGLGNVVEGVLSAYVAGYVFFVVFALLPEYRSRAKIADALFGRVGSIVGDCFGLLPELEKAFGKGIIFISVTGPEVERAFSAIPIAHVPAFTINGQPANLFDLFLYRQGRSLDAIAELFELGRYLDPELVAILDRIRRNVFFAETRPKGIVTTNLNLGAWGPSFFKYIKLRRELRKWHNKNRVPGIMPISADLR